ncbi:MAG: hypothetical protein GXC73_17895 [Chitinophagaceae bacterium]|nr:hypothetical protein [Chitinophagaceae bacterium]
MKLFDRSIGWYGKAMFICSIFFCCCKLSLAQSGHESPTASSTSLFIQPERQKQDLLVLKQSLQKNHPGLYRYKTKKQIDLLFDSCFASIHRPVPALEFAKLIAYLVSNIQDGHTASNAPKLLMNEYMENEVMFPAYVYFIGQKAFILCSKAQNLPQAVELLSIDNISIAVIKNTLLRYLPADGNIETKKIHTLNNGAFIFLYRWIYGKKEGFSVKYKTKEEVIKTTFIIASPVKGIDCPFTTGPYYKKNLQFDILQNNTALVTIKTFDDNRLGGNQVFRLFLDSVFTEIKARNINSLILDLRGNGGGRDEYGALLYSYLTNKPFGYFRTISTVNNKVSNQNNDLLGLLQPQSNSYTGKVLFLINGLSFSTTADFCAIAKSNNRGSFIGEETGGACEGNTSGKMKTVSLPNSGLILKIPLFKYMNDVKAIPLTGRGIIPDVKIIPSIEDIILQKDIQLQYTLQYLFK